MPHSVTSDSNAGAMNPDELDAQTVTNGTSGHDDAVEPDNSEDVDMVESGNEPAAAPATVKLEDLFADDDLDGALADPKTQTKLESSPPPPASSPVRLELDLNSSDPEVMRAFYQRLFPWRYLFQWLNHSPTPTSDFGHREFAFTLQNDAYLRYQSFPTADLLRKDVLRLNPSRFEIGPVYSANPRDRKTLRDASSFRPLSKELCFDIDLTDYDFRTCCEKANICHKCWQFITMSIKVLDVALREDFGFKNIIWIYSGRRGAHAWVCDKRARQLLDHERKAIVGYLQVISGGAQSQKKVNARRPLHPHLARSLDALKSHFQTDVLEDQDPWAESDKAEQLLQLLPDQTLNESLRKKWNSAPGRSSVSKWTDIDALAKSGASKKLDTKALLEAKQDIVLEYTYPRLDAEVSKKLNHLLKSPFVVHPGTGRVCVPIDVSRVESFDPLAVPTVTQLLQEIDQWSRTDNQTEDGKPLQDWEKTSLKPFVEYFRSFVATLLRDEAGVKVKRERDEAEAMEF